VVSAAGNPASYVYYGDVLMARLSTSFLCLEVWPLSTAPGRDRALLTRVQVVKWQEVGIAEMSGIGIVVVFLKITDTTASKGTMLGPMNQVGKGLSPL